MRPILLHQGTGIKGLFEPSKQNSTTWSHEMGTVWWLYCVILKKSPLSWYELSIKIILTVLWSSQSKGKTSKCKQNQNLILCRAAIEGQCRVQSCTQGAFTTLLTEKIPLLPTEHNSKGKTQCGRYFPGTRFCQAVVFSLENRGFFQNKEKNSVLSLW